jgi:hypothetical protein
VVGDGFTVSRDPIQKPGNGKTTQGKDELHVHKPLEYDSDAASQVQSNQKNNNDAVSRQYLNQLYHQFLQSINPMREPSKQLTLTSRAFSLVLQSLSSVVGPACYSKVNQTLRKVYKKKSLGRYPLQLTSVLRERGKIAQTMRLP